MNIEKYKGIFPALLTPFNKDGSINTIQLEKLVEYNINKGVDGFYVDGSTGSAFMLSQDERKLILKTVCDVAKGKCTLIGQIGCINQDSAIELAEYCDALGYDAVSSVPPFYYKFSFNEIKSYYDGIAKSVGIPMLMYYIPAFSGVTFSAENIGYILSSDRFIGVKYTSNDYFGLERVKSSYPDKVVYNGYDEMMLAGLSMGADGGIGSTYNFMAEKFIALRNAFIGGNIPEAQRIQKEANDIIAALIKVGVMQGENAVLDMLGFDMGDCRQPFKKLTDDEKAYLRKTVLPLL